MAFRTVRYTRHRPDEAAVAEAFIDIEAEVDGGVRHALLVPRHWDLLTQIPIDPAPDAPVLDSVVVEDPELGDRGAVFASGWVPVSFASDAKGAVQALAARDGFSVYRWNDEDDDAGGARAMASDKTRIAAIRVLPYGDRWAFFTAIGPKDRLGEFGGALQHALISWRLYPHWAQDPDAT